MPLQKLEGVTEQSSPIGVSGAPIPLNIALLEVVPPGQWIHAETTGSGNKQAAGSNPDKDALIGHKESDSFPAGRKRRAEFPVEDAHLWLTGKGFKIHKIRMPFIDIGDN